MTRIMLDTNAYSAFKRGDEKTIRLLSRADQILVPTPVLGELRSGFRAARTPIPINDIWIAAAAMESGSILVSRDSHFDAAGGLVRW